MPAAAYSLLLVGPAQPAADVEDPLAADLAALGCRLLGRCDIPELVREAGKLAPELVICAMPAASDGLFTALAELTATAPVPVLLITDRCAPETLARALDAGVHGWAAGWLWSAASAARETQRHRLAAELHGAHARFTRDAAARATLADTLARLDERKWVERAKGVLMAARQVSEDDAFRLLRGASMHTNLRVGEVSRNVIEAAQRADAVNRAGQLRMLSQRVVRLLAQCAAGVEARRSRELLDESCERVRDNLERLQPLAAVATAAPALGEVVQAWARLQPLLAGAPPPAALREADAQAESLLAHAERLTAAIEGPDARLALHIVNVSGRQRMLVQRLAKDALLDALLDDAAARERVHTAAQEFSHALDALDRAPLSSAEIRETLASARAEWLRMAQALRDPRAKRSVQALAQGSETLLALFDKLTEMYERSLLVIMGG